MSSNVVSRLRSPYLLLCALVRIRGRPAAAIAEQYDGVFTITELLEAGRPAADGC